MVAYLQKTPQKLVCVHAARSSTEVEEDIVRGANEAGLLSNRWATFSHPK